MRADGVRSSLSGPRVLIARIVSFGTKNLAAIELREAISTAGPIALAETKPALDRHDGKVSVTHLTTLRISERQPKLFEAALVRPGPTAGAAIVTAGKRYAARELLL